LRSATISAVSIIAMKMSGAALSRSGSIDSFGEPPPGIEMFRRRRQRCNRRRRTDELAAIAMVCSPDEQKRLTETPAVDFGMPRAVGLAADIGGAMRAIAEIAIFNIPLSTPARFTACSMACAAMDIGGVMLNPPRPDFASPVRA
jgi:hypothetical protein